MIKAVLVITIIILVHKVSTITSKCCFTEDELLKRLDRIEKSINEKCLPAPPRSCQDIKRKDSSSSSGFYDIFPDGKTAKRVYCHMDTICGSNGGWTRVVSFDVSNRGQTCPTGMRLYTGNGVRGCGRRATRRGSCQRIGMYSTQGVAYTEVCGRVRGYQYGSPDANDYNFAPASVNYNLNQHYVDGISLTKGSPRQHIWTFMAGLKEDNTHRAGTFTCPCQPGSKQAGKVQSFVGNNYFCESGNPAAPRGAFRIQIYPDPLWDGKQCRTLERPCCKSALGLPFFHRKLAKQSTDYLEARVCCDQSTNDEDVLVEQMEIYVK